MDDKHDPNARVPTGTFRTPEEDEFEIPIDVVMDGEHDTRLTYTQLKPEHEAIVTSGDELEALRGPDEVTRPDIVPRRRRTSTLLGVPLPTVDGLAAKEAAADADLIEIPADEIRAALDQLLDDSTDIYGRDARDLALEKLVESEMKELPASNPPGEIVGVAAHRSEDAFDAELPDSQDATKVPVLAPAQFVEARARDQRDQPASAGQPASKRPSYATLPGQSENAKSKSKTRERTPALHSSTVSSLAPMEVSRSPAVKKREDPSSATGFALVAVMVLAGIGGWWFTSGGFDREFTPQPSAASSAPSSTPATPPRVAAVPKPVEEVSPAPTPPPQPLGDAPEVKDARSTKPRLAGSARTPRKPAAQAPLDGVAEVPSRDAVLNGLDGVRASVRACAEGRSGVAEVDLTIAANGVVTNALVGGDFRGTPEGSCIARAVRKARFPEFKQDRFRLLYPYLL